MYATICLPITEEEKESDAANGETAKPEGVKSEVSESAKTENANDDDGVKGDEVKGVDGVKEDGAKGDGEVKVERVNGDGVEIKSEDLKILGAKCEGAKDDRFTIEPTKPDGIPVSDDVKLKCDVPSAPPAFVGNHEAPGGGDEINGEVEKRVEKLIIKREVGETRGIAGKTAATRSPDDLVRPGGDCNANGADVKTELVDEAVAEEKVAEEEVAEANGKEIADRVDRRSETTSTAENSGGVNVAEVGVGATPANGNDVVTATTEPRSETAAATNDAKERSRAVNGDIGKTSESDERRKETEDSATKSDTDANKEDEETQSPSSKDSRKRNLKSFYFY